VTARSGVGLVHSVKPKPLCPERPNQVRRQLALWGLVMTFEEPGHRNTAPEDWQDFRRWNLSHNRSNIDEVLYRSEVQLPPWFLPLARGVANRERTLTFQLQIIFPVHTVLVAERHSITMSLLCRSVLENYWCAVSPKGDSGRSKGTPEALVLTCPDSSDHG
jgi:hypothetical protein